jgi:flagellar secretion chaperone FliS
MNSEQGYGSPMTSISTLRGRYKTDSVETMSPGRLIVALYERLLLDLQRAVEAIVREDVAATHASLVHAQDIIGELRDSLDTETWPAATQLAGLYDFVLRELVEANVSKDAARVVTCHDLLVPLCDAWSEAAGLTVSPQP